MYNRQTQWGWVRPSLRIGLHTRHSSFATSSGQAWVRGPDGVYVALVGAQEQEAETDSGCRLQVRQYATVG